MLRAIAAAGLCLAAILGAGCAGDSNGEDDKDAFIQDAEDKIAGLRSQLLEVRDDVATGEAGEEVHQQAEGIERHIDEAETELDEIRAANEGEWQDLRTEFDEAVGEADAMLNDVLKDIGLN